jgi:hypothetical protein
MQDQQEGRRSYRGRRPFRASGSLLELLDSGMRRCRLQGGRGERAHRRDALVATPPTHLRRSLSWDQRTQTGVTTMAGNAGDMALNGRRVRGVVVDGRTIEADFVIDASGRTGSVIPIVGAYRAMIAGPSVLAQIEERARANLRSGLRPSVPDGPTGDELAVRIAQVGC